MNEFSKLCQTITTNAPSYKSKAAVERILTILKLRFVAAGSFGCLRDPLEDAVFALQLRYVELLGIEREQRDEDYADYMSGYIESDAYFSSVEFDNGYNDRRYGGTPEMRNSIDADYRAGWERAERDIDERLEYLADEAAAGLL